MNDFMTQIPYWIYDKHLKLQPGDRTLSSDQEKKETLRR